VRGTPLAVLAMVRALSELGHTVDLLTYPRGTDVPVPGVRPLRSLSLPVGRVRPGPSLAKLTLDVPFMLEAWARMAFGKYDVVHAVEEAAHLAAPVARLLKLPLVMDVDSSIPDQLRYTGFATRGPLLWAAERLERSALAGARTVVTVCTSLTDGVRRRAPAAEIFQIEDPPLVDASAPPPSAADVATLRTALGIGRGPVVLYSGNFEPYQGVPLLADAAALLPELWFVFMGGDADAVAAVRARLAAARAGTRCVFTGTRPPSELPAFLALADVLVSPRIRGENTPFKVYSYMASGKPLVATRIATHTQLLDDTLAILVEPDAEAIAAGIRLALTDPSARKRAQKARELLEREYSPRRFREKVARAYAGILPR
jgi:glycosyltransferase involved in cell wall biosynthesis